MFAAVIARMRRCTTARRCAAVKPASGHGVASQKMNLMNHSNGPDQGQDFQLSILTLSLSACRCSKM